VCFLFAKTSKSTSLITTRHSKMSVSVSFTAAKWTLCVYLLLAKSCQCHCNDGQNVIKTWQLKAVHTHTVIHLENIWFDSHLPTGPFVHLEAFADKGKWCLVVSANKPVFVNGLTLGFSRFEAKVFDERILCVESIRSISSHFWRLAALASELFIYISETVLQKTTL